MPMAGVRAGWEGDAREFHLKQNRLCVVTRPREKRLPEGRTVSEAAAPEIPTYLALVNPAFLG